MFMCLVYSFVFFKQKTAYGLRISDWSSDVCSSDLDPVFGGLALFVLAMGMGLPLLAFGAAAGRGMPTSGPWMTGVQRVFGFVFLALAVWMLSRIVPGPDRKSTRLNSSH